MTLKELRLSKKLTQIEAAKYVNVPIRTYKNYENDENKVGNLKYQYLMEKIADYGYIDEEQGLLTMEMIVEGCNSVFDQYEIEYCYLFGSYAKNNAHEKSDVDLLISTNVTGLEFYGLIERLRNKLNKKIDLLTVNQIDKDLFHEILLSGIKIYG